MLSVFDSIDSDLVTLQRKEDAMGAYPESVAIAFGLQLLHVTLEIVALNSVRSPKLRRIGFFKARNC